MKESSWNDESFELRKPRITVISPEIMDLASKVVAYKPATEATNREWAEQSANWICNADFGDYE